MTDSAPSGAPPSEPIAYPAAGLDRRFYAFAADRVVAGGLAAAAVGIAWSLLPDRGHSGTGLGAVAGVVVGALLGIGVAFAVVQGLTGVTPGKALLGLRTTHHDTGGTIGVGRALLRGSVLGVAALPTFGLGLATLAWTAVMDPGRRRRGWHDVLARSVVVDVRPAAPVEVTVDSGPPELVNLTAMRLVPAAAPSTPQPGPQWRVAFDTGDTVIVEGLVLVGRRPQGRPGEPVRHVVPLPSTDLSLSKTHAQLHLAPDGVLVVMDRGSTNGSRLVRRGVTRDLAAGRPATLLDGDTVTFGDRRMRVTRVR